MILICPTMDGHETTRRMVESLKATVAEPEKLHLIVYDNNSLDHYTPTEFGEVPFRLTVVHTTENKGYYKPLATIYDLIQGRNPMFNWKEDERLMGLIHNDVVMYDRGWDTTLRGYFQADARLGLVGFCGSNEVDENGGRGGGTMCNFVGNPGFQPPAAGRHIDKLEPALVLDSLFMLLRMDAIDDLKIEDSIPLGHFYDKLWGCRLTEANWHVAIAPISIDHESSVTMIANPRYFEDAERWCKRWGVPPSPIDGSYGTGLYQEAERHFLGEFRDQKHFIPCKIGADYSVTR